MNENKQVVIENLIPDLDKVKQWLNGSMSLSREHIIYEASSELAHHVAAKLYECAANSKRMLEVDWRAVLSTYPVVFKRKAAKKVAEVLLAKGYIVTSPERKERPWSLMQDRHQNNFVIITPSEHYGQEMEATKREGEEERNQQVFDSDSEKKNTLH